MSLNQADVICILICSISGYIGYRRGAIRTLISFLGIIASFAIAWIFSEMLGEWLMTQSIFVNFVSGLNLETMVQNLLNTGIQENISTNSPFGEAFFLGAQNLLNESAATITAILVQGIARIMSFIILMIGTTVVFGILQQLFQVISELPVIGSINRFIGVLIGLLLGICFCTVILWAFALLNHYSGGTINLPSLENGLIMEVVIPKIKTLVT
jgi:uncharacterized membrane protein required for colicin V production